MSEQEANPGAVINAVTIDEEAPTPSSPQQAVEIADPKPAEEASRKSHFFDIEAVLALPRDSKILFVTRFIRMFAYGILSVVLVLFLNSLGLTVDQAGWLLALTLVGDIFISLFVTANGDYLGRKKMLVFGSVLMLVAGVAYAVFPSFSVGNTFNWGLFVLLCLIGVIGVVSPSGNEVGPFTALEQSILTSQIEVSSDRTAVFAWYGLVGQLATALGSIVSGWSSSALMSNGNSDLITYRVIAGIYGAIAILLIAAFTLLTPRVEFVPKDPAAPQPRRKNPLQGLVLKPESRGIVVQLCCLFTLDAFAGGMVAASFLSLYFNSKFGVSDGYLGTMLFFTNLFAAASSLAAAYVVKKVGLINTMVFTHLPSNILILLVPFMPNVGWATAMLIARFSISQMDTAPRNAFVAGIVPAEERTAVIGITNIVRTIGMALGPLLTGYLAQTGHFDAVFVICGSLKIIYDLLLLFSARKTDMAKK